MKADLPLPIDPALPQLARAMNADDMAAVFAEALRAHGASVESCEVERIKYRPRRNCTLAYRLRVRDLTDGRIFEQRVAARLCGNHSEVARRAARAAAKSLLPSVAGPTLRVLPSLDMLTWWWPNDGKLRAPQVLADELRLADEVLPQVVARLSDGRGRLRGHRVEVVQYVPEHRLTARVTLCWREGGRGIERLLYAKASREPDSAAAHALLAALQASSAWREGRLRTPAALLWQPAAGLHWQQAMAGRAWLDLPAAQTESLAPALGAQLAALHATVVPVARRLDAEALRSRLAEVVSVLTDALPRAGDALARSAAALDERLPDIALLPPATLHGDLHPRNILVDGSQLSLIDLDGLRRGPAVLELGSWIADGIYRAVLDGQSPQRDASAQQRLLDAYADAAGEAVEPRLLASATAWALLTQRAWRCVVNLKPGRFAIAPRLVELAASCAEGTAALQVA